MSKQFFIRTAKIIFESRESPLHKTNIFFQQHSLLIYLITLLSFIVLLPGLYDLVFEYKLLSIFFLALVFIAGLYIVSVNAQVLMISILLTLLIASIWGININLGNTKFFLFGLGLMIVFFILTMGTIIVEIFSSKKITSKELIGAICIYLLMAIIWSLIYIMIEHVSPGAFHAPQSTFAVEYASRGIIYPQFLYYSFITLTTLGYGDITPVLGIAQLLSALEAVMGQLYLTILIARLVGLHVVIK